MDSRTQSSPKQKRLTTRADEVALLESISTSLDNYLVDSSTSKKKKKKKKKEPPETITQNAPAISTRDFLATKTLVKTIAKACTQESNASGEELTDTSALAASVLDVYKEKYPSLTQSMLVEGIMHRYNNDQKGGGEEDMSPTKEDDDGHTQFHLERIFATVNAEMKRYHEKIEALKMSRKASIGESEPEPRKRPRLKRDTPESFLVEEIVKKYAVERETNNRVNCRRFEAIVEETKKEHGMQEIVFDLSKLQLKVTALFRKLTPRPESERPVNTTGVLVEEIFTRYSATKVANWGEKLPPKTLDKIIDDVKLEFDEPTFHVAHLKQKIRARFTKENPEFENGTGKQKIDDMPDEMRRRRQLLLNEVTARYAKSRDGIRKVEDGTLDRIIEQTKVDLDIHDVDVNKASIRGRFSRKSLVVRTLGKESPYKVIDEPLVSTINGWLNGGISVTPERGLGIANLLLKGKTSGKDAHGNDIVLGARWWRSFLKRNANKLRSLDSET